RPEVVLVEARSRQQVPVVVEPDVVGVAAERAAVPAPVGGADPRRHEDRQHAGEGEDDDHGCEEEPAGRSLMAANTGLTQPPPRAYRQSFHRRVLLVLFTRRLPPPWSQ